MIFKETYNSEIEDFTKEGKLSFSAVLKIFENMGNRHSDLAGDSRFKYDGTETAWVLTEWQIQAESFPLYTDKIRAETWAEEVKSPLVAIRDFRLYKNDSVCIRGNSKWVLLDLKTQRLCRIGQEFIDKYQPEPQTVFADSNFSKIKEPENYSFEKRIQIRRSDFDFNNHIHNITYLDYALETIPEEVYKSLEFKNLRISYKTAIKDDKEVIGRYYEEAGKKVLGIYDDANQLKAMVQIW